MAVYQGTMQTIGTFMLDEESIAYFEAVKQRFKSEPYVFKYLVAIITECQNERLDVIGLIKRIRILFEHHPDLVYGFNRFLPPGYQIYPMRIELYAAPV